LDKPSLYAVHKIRPWLVLQRYQEEEHQLHHHHNHHHHPVLWMTALLSYCH